VNTTIRRRLVLPLTLLLSGCAATEYYAQALRGQWELWSRSRPIAELLDDPALSEPVRRKLRGALDARRFASEALRLPDNDSYRTYADLERPYVVWNVFAAPALSLEPRRSCFPVAGCVIYRGYFIETHAESYAAGLRAQGDDVYVAGVPAYSTLGWFDDPVPNTILHYDDAVLAGLIFHELAHQLVYVAGDSRFNESFATAVEEEGVRRYLESRGDFDVLARYRARQKFEEEFIALVFEYRGRLETLYAGFEADEAKRLRKAELLAELQRRLAPLAERSPRSRILRRWTNEPLGNAHLASVAAYHELVPAFRALLARTGGDLPRFYTEVRRLAELPAAEREEGLKAVNREK
jgi:predicted aminopeptidase